MNLTKVGDKYKKFIVTKHLFLSEIQANLTELEHEETKATIMHIDNGDDDNLFSLCFQTLPTSSNGAPHILEHVALCGSKKFPVKDPFFAMTRRSLNTFMNAMTGQDFTCYPASSQVEKDFYNLLTVYLDAAFHPQIKELSFLQEGHRLEFSEPKDPKSPLVYKGVVYNEMKGALNSAESRLWHDIMKHLFPDLTYAYNSGGDPAEIPSLSYKELKEFHKNFYHPSRCLFFFYGNLPIKQHLDFLEHNALKGCKALSPIPPIPKQSRYTSTKTFFSQYPISKDEPKEKKSYLSYAWLTCPITDQEEVLALTLLDKILMDTDASLLKMPLLKSNFCSQVDSALDTELSEIPWIIICKGCEKEHLDKLFKVIEKTLKEIVRDKIDKKLIDAAMHQLEFSRSEISGQGYPYGLSLFFRSALIKQHGCDPESGLLIHSLFEKLKNKLKDDNYLPSLIEKYFLKNTHQVHIAMEPDENLANLEEKIEKEKLTVLSEKLTHAEKQKILDQTEKLEKYQEEIEHQSLSCLPKISIKDIPRDTVKDFLLTKEKVNDIDLYYHDCFTNNIVYSDFIFDLPEIDKEDIFYLSLFTSILTEIGCANRDYKQNLEYINAYTGGINAYLSLNIPINDFNQCHPTLAFRGKALYRNSDKLFALIKELATSCDFSDKERIKEILLQQYTFMESTLSQQAMSYAIETAVSGLSTPSYISEQLDSLSYFTNLRTLIKNFDKNFPILLEKLHNFKATVFSIKSPSLVLSCDEKHINNLKKHHFYGLEELNFTKSPLWNPQYKIPSTPSQGKTIASPVAFTASACKTIGYEHENSSSLLVSTNLMENLILHPTIREKGGAYGSGASYSPSAGQFYFYAYRDPNLTKSLNAFEKAVQEIAKGNFSDTNLEEAKLGIMQKIDAPINVGNRAIIAYKWLKTKKTKEKRLAYRNQILFSTKEDIIKAVKQDLLPNIAKETIVSFASDDFLKKENILLEKDHKKTLPIKKI